MRQKSYHSSTQVMNWHTVCNSTPIC